MTFAKTRTTGYFRSRLQRLAHLGRAHGPTRALYRIAKRLSTLPIVRVCVRLDVVEVLTAPADRLRSTVRIPKSFVVERATDEAELTGYFERADLVQKRLAAGDVCLVTRCGGKLGAGVWISPGPSRYDENRGELGCTIGFPAGVAWSYDGKGTRWGAWGALMARLPELLDELELVEVYTLIDYDNQESLAGHRSLGYQRVGLVACVALLGLSLTVCVPEDRRWHFAPGCIGKLELVRGG